jgi:hypothetical protein
MIGIAALPWRAAIMRMAGSRRPAQDALGSVSRRTEGCQAWLDKIRKQGLLFLKKKKQKDFIHEVLGVATANPN